MRRIDPAAEAIRLAEARKARFKHVLCDELDLVLTDGMTGKIHLRVTSTVAPSVLNVDLGAKIAALVRAECYPGSQP
jgi:hypothetical protein